jgi:hypothetical protein
VSESANTVFGGNSQTIAALYSNLYIASYKDVGTTLEVNSDWTDKFSTVFRATYRDWDKGQDPPYGQNFSEVTVCAAPTSDATLTACPATFSQLRFGPDISRHANQLNIEEAQFQLIGTYQLTNNRLKFGVQANHKDVYNVFVQRARGAYYFDSIADFAAGRANRLDYNDAVSGNTQRRRRDLRLLGDVGLPAGHPGDHPRPDRHRRLPLRPAVDGPDSDRQPQLRARNGFTNISTLDGYDVVMPRVSGEWTPTSSLKFTGGFGRFSGGYPEVLFATPFYNTGYQTSSVQINRTATGFAEASNTPGFTPAIGARALDNLNADPQLRPGPAGPGSPTAARQARRRAFCRSTPPSPCRRRSNCRATGRPICRASGPCSTAGAWASTTSPPPLEDAITYRDYRAQPLIVNGVRATTPDGRVRYDNLTATAAQRVAQGITSVAPTNNSPNLDLVAENADKGDSWTAALTLSKSFGFGVDISAGYAKQKSNELNAGLRFGTTDSSLYQNPPAGLDPAYDAFGRSIEEIENRFKLELGYRQKFFGDNETRISFFGERYAGRPFGFAMNDTATSGRNRTFGVTRLNHLLYVPDIAGDTNTTDLDVGLVTLRDRRRPRPLPRLRQAVRLGEQHGPREEHQHEQGHQPPRHADQPGAAVDRGWSQVQGGARPAQRPEPDRSRLGQGA